MDTETPKKTDSQHGCCRGSTVLNNSRLHGAFTLVLILLAAFLFSSTVNALKEYKFIGLNVVPANLVSVSGEGELFAVPDTAEFTFSVFEEGATAKGVQEAAEAKTSSAINMLKERGIEDKDIKTIAYELQPKYEWESPDCFRYPCPGKQVQNGYTLTQTVRIKVRDIDLAGDMLVVVTDSGVSNISSINFTIDDEDGLRANARKLAIDDASAKAKKLAEDLGVSLGRIVSFSENNGYSPMPYARDMMMAEGIGGGLEKSSLPVGENRITSNVNITYEIR